MEPVTLLAGVLVLMGLLGIVVPLLPGLLLVWAGALLWAVSVHTAGAWLVLGLVSAVAVLGMVLKYVLPGRHLRSSSVGTPTMLAGVAVGVVGFFVVPVVGGVLGFVLGIFLAELLRLRSTAAAWPSTVTALKAVGLGMLVELAAGFAMAGTWVVGLLTVG
ncbi:MAG: DUF456 domain-containing protein [Oryzihumus sp.]